MSHTFKQQTATNIKMGGHEKPPVETESNPDTVTSVDINTFNPQNLLECYDEHNKAFASLLKNAKKLLYSELETMGTVNKRLAPMIRDAKEIYESFDGIYKKGQFYIEQNRHVFRCYDETQAAPAQDDPRWLVMRNNGIGASEAEMVKAKDGANKKRWIKEKSGRYARSFNGNWVTDQGHQMEPVVGHILDHLYGTFLLESTSLEHPKYPFIRASLDRYGWIHGMPYIIEIKSPVTRVPVTGYIPSGYDQQMYQQHEVSYIENGLFADSQFQLFDSLTELMRSFGDNEHLPKKYYGAIIKYPHSKRAFTYSPIAVRSRLKHWVKEMSDTLVQTYGYSIAEKTQFWEPLHPECKFVVKIVYWKLNRLVLVPHMRNHKWCEQNLAAYRRVWNEIVEYKRGLMDEVDVDIAANADVFSGGEVSESESDSEPLFGIAAKKKPAPTPLVTHKPYVPSKGSVF